MYLFGNKLLKTIIPTSVGFILSINFIRLIDAFYSGKKYLDPGHLDNDDTILYILLIPVFIAALLFQFFVTLPLWKTIRSKGKVFGTKIVSKITMLCIVSALFFTVVIGRIQFGVIDLIVTFLCGLALSIVYWSVNLLSINLLDKVFTQNGR